MRNNRWKRIAVWALLAVLLLAGCTVSEPLQTEKPVPTAVISEPTEPKTEPTETILPTEAEETIPPTEAEETQPATVPEDS